MSPSSQFGLPNGKAGICRTMILFTATILALSSTRHLGAEPASAPSPSLFAAIPSKTSDKPELLKSMLLVSDIRIQQLEDDLETSRKQIARLLATLDLLGSDLRSARGGVPAHGTLVARTVGSAAGPASFMVLGEWVRIEGALDVPTSSLVETTLSCHGQVVETVIEIVGRGSLGEIAQLVTWLPSKPCSGGLSVSRSLVSN